MRDGLRKKQQSLFHFALQLRLFTFLTSTQLLGCRQPAEHTLTLDDWANVRAVKESCRYSTEMLNSIRANSPGHFGCEAVPGCTELQSTVAACGSDDGVRSLRDFESEFKSSFQQDTGCKGVYLYEATPTNEDTVATSWTLNFMFRPGEALQGWQLSKMKSSLKSTFGNGNPGDFAHGVCKVILGKGGLIEEP